MKKLFLALFMIVFAVSAFAGSATVSVDGKSRSLTVSEELLSTVTTVEEVGIVDNVTDAWKVGNTDNVTISFKSSVYKPSVGTVGLLLQFVDDKGNAVALSDNFTNVVISGLQDNLTYVANSSDETNGIVYFESDNASLTTTTLKMIDNGSGSSLTLSYPKDAKSVSINAAFYYETNEVDTASVKFLETKSEWETAVVGQAATAKIDPASNFTTFTSNNTADTIRIDVAKTGADVPADNATLKTVVKTSNDLKALNVTIADDENNCSFKSDDNTTIECARTIDDTNDNVTITFTIDGSTEIPQTTFTLESATLTEIDGNDTTDKVLTVTDPNAGEWQYSGYTAYSPFIYKGDNGRHTFCTFTNKSTRDANVYIYEVGNSARYTIPGKETLASGEKLTVTAYDIFDAFGKTANGSIPVQFLLTTQEGDVFGNCYMLDYPNNNVRSVPLYKKVNSEDTYLSE